MPDGKPSVVDSSPNQAASISDFSMPLSTPRDRLGVGHRHQILDTQFEVLGEGRHARADDGDVSHALAPSETTVRPGQNAYP